MSLVRAPQGITGELFFQKHLDKGEIQVAVLEEAISASRSSTLRVTIRINAGASAARWMSYRGAAMQGLATPSRFPGFQPGQSLPVTCGPAFSKSSHAATAS